MENSTGNVVSWREATSGVLSVVMNRPPANALGLPLLEGMHLAMDAAEAAGNVKVMIISSARPGFFAAGADIKHLSTIDSASFTEYGDVMRAVNDRLEAAPWISIAAVDGLALGGGCELAMACTLRVAGPSARFGLPEVKLGLIPGAGGTQRLPRLVGHSRTLDMMLTARQVGVEEAARIGLVDRVAADDVLDAARALADELLGPSVPAQLAAIRAVTAAGDLPFEQGARVEVDEIQSLFEHGEAAEGISAFIEKRKPDFR